MKSVCIIFLALMICPVSATVKLPSVISDNMMIQRDMPITIWGWSDKGETVSLTFNNQTVKTKAGKDGVWKAELKAMPYGGPYQMTIKGKSNTIQLSNILIGDIWVCSGQSNMEWILYNANNGKEEIKNANYPNIRLLQIEKSISNIPLQDAVSKGWEVCSPQSADDFSAVGYFFGRAIHKELDIPIGLINTSWGGTGVETWTSIPAITPYIENKKIMEELQSPLFSQRLSKKEETDINNILKTEIGLEEKWFLPETNLSGWQTTNVPGDWSSMNINGNGVVWYRKEFTLTSEQAQNAAMIVLGGIDDRDETYLNGKLIGRTNEYSANRQYIVCPDGMKTGNNVLTVKVVNTGGAAGFYYSADKIYCQTIDSRISLAGEWKYRLSMIIDASNSLSPNDYPSLLYNAMIAPLTYFPIKGAIWYQGEHNAFEAYRYRTLFPNMIADWRKAWKQPDFPFYFVQLANFMAPASLPENSEWAELREAQHLTLQTPNTGEAVIIDIGEADDIHPKNKQDVGYRLALNALSKTYKKNTEYSGPEYKSMQIKDNSIILTFDHTGKGLIARGKYGYLQGFSIAGADQKFVWAQAKIEGDKVIVSSDQIKKPVAVRYAWANNPDDANLYNSEGLPASPFRTDNWKITTQK
ncbi:MAG: beta galactosidase jelly roll domain-containing protein [Dysgonamonadaceae bacterium]|nr:beta galactosidase jelly roll domain-containing protein [Dysgonamonadaceae bacterium]